MVVYGETAVFGRELIFLSAEGGYVAFVVFELVGFTWAVYFAPGFAVVGGGVDVSERCGRHVGGGPVEGEWMNARC